MIRPRLLGLLSALLLVSTGLVAQDAIAPAPFDMSPESELRAAPGLTTPTVPNVIVPMPVAAPPGIARPIVPFDQLQLVGEDARRAIDVYLTQAQADAPAMLDVGYLNAVVASPEASRLSIVINGTTVLAGPIASSGAIGHLVAELPAGLLRAGANLIEFEAIQRHRTDCSVASTYELWTQIDPASTVLRFEGAGLDRIVQLGDIAAIGFDAAATTTVRFVIPELAVPAVTAAAMELVQQLSLALHVPEIVVEIVAALPAETPQGTLNVVLATAGMLPSELDMMRAQAGAGPIAAFVPPTVAGNTLVVSGPDWSSVLQAMRAISAASKPSDPDLLLQRVDLAYPIPRVTGATALTLDYLGVPTVEFNGRRFRTAFEFALPSDFYANMYGQAQLVLDAAYSNAVLPGSQFDVYANGQIASATPVLRTDGGMFRNTAIKIPMTNFRPGRNEIELEVLLQTEEDVGCAPGLTQDAAPRFLFSASSQLTFPDFARAGSFPDLAAFAGTGAPYVGPDAVPLMLGAGDQVVPSAMTWLARLAIASGRVFQVRLVSADQLDPAADVLIVAPLPSLSDAMLARSGVTRTVATAAANDGAILDRFNDTVGAPTANLFESLRNWAARQIGIEPTNLRLFRSADPAYVPPAEDAVVLAQATQPEGGVWTFLTIADETKFTEAVQRLTQTGNWRAIGGRITALGSDDAEVISVAPNKVILRQTEPLSLFNARLIAANWLSTNVLQFTVLLGLVTLFLTLATAALLRGLGRRQ